MLDRALPSALSETTLNISELLPYLHMAYRIELNEASMRYQIIGEGSRI